MCGQPKAGGRKVCLFDFQKIMKAVFLPNREGSDVASPVPIFLNILRKLTSPGKIDAQEFRNTMDSTIQAKQSRLTRWMMLAAMTALTFVVASPTASALYNTHTGGIICSSTQDGFVCRFCSGTDDWRVPLIDPPNGIVIWIMTDPFSDHDNSQRVGYHNNC